MGRKGHTTLSVEFEGKTFTRTTDHKYLFVVFARWDRAADARKSRGEWTADERKKLAAEWRMLSADSKRLAHIGVAPLPPLAEYLAERAKGWAEFAAKPGRYDWGDHRWSASRKAAESYATNLRGCGFEATVVPIPVAVPAPAPAATPA